jgi:hypothetical protein
MEVMELIPVRQPINKVTMPLLLRGNIDAVQDIDMLSEFQSANVHSKQFIESNTSEVTLSHLRNECVIPVFCKDNEVTISHVNFIETVFEAASKVFPRERIDKPEIRVSHIIKGRTPEAINKPVNELLDRDKTIYYERMAFVIEIPTIVEDIQGNTLTLSIGGVRSYNQQNLYSKKTSEKFKVFIGFKNMVCCNMCISTDGYKEEVKAISTYELLQRVVQLFQLYNIQKHLSRMNSFKNYGLSEHQFAQLIGKSKLYQCLPAKERKLLPNLEFNDSHINIIARNYYKDEAFSRGSNQIINLWNVYNLFTSANKNSYIDTFLDRSVNATDFIYGISEALQGSTGYRWFIE